MLHYTFLSSHLHRMFKPSHSLSPWSLPSLYVDISPTLVERLFSSTVCLDEKYFLYFFVFSVTENDSQWKSFSV